MCVVKHYISYPDQVPPGHQHTTSAGCHPPALLRMDLCLLLSRGVTQSHTGHRLVQRSNFISSDFEIHKYEVVNLCFIFLGDSAIFISSTEGKKY